MTPLHPSAQRPRRLFSFDSLPEQRYLRPIYLSRGSVHAPHKTGALALHWFSFEFFFSYFPHIRTAAASDGYGCHHDRKAGGGDRFDVDRDEAKGTLV